MGTADVLFVHLRSRFIFCVLVTDNALRNILLHFNCRCRRIFHQLHLDDFDAVYMEILGTESMYGRLSNIPQVRICQSCSNWRLCRKVGCLYSIYSYILMENVW